MIKLNGVNRLEQVQMEKKASDTRNIICQTNATAKKIVKI